MNLTEVIADAMEKTNDNGAAGRLVAATVLDEVEITGEPEALDAVDQLINAGGYRLVASARPKSHGRVATKRGTVKAGSGVRRLDTETGRVLWEQESFPGMTRDDIAQAIRMEAAHLNAATDRIAALRSLDRLMQKYPTAATVEDALNAEGVSLAEWLAA